MKFAGTGKVCVIDADVATAADLSLALEGIPNVEITGVWVSLP